MSIHKILKKSSNKHEFLRFFMIKIDSKININYIINSYLFIIPNFSKNFYTYLKNTLLKTYKITVKYILKIKKICENY